MVSSRSALDLCARNILSAATVPHFVDHNRPHARIRCRLVLKVTHLNRRWPIVIGGTNVGSVVNANFTARFSNHSRSARASLVEVRPASRDMTDLDRPRRASASASQGQRVFERGGSHTHHMGRFLTVTCFICTEFRIAPQAWAKTNLFMTNPSRIVHAGGEA